MRDQATKHAEDAVSLAECGVGADMDGLVQVLTTAFRESFGSTFQSDSLSELERAGMEELLVNKYRTDQWNLEGATE